MNKIDFKKIIGFSLLFLGLILVVFLPSVQAELNEIIGSPKVFHMLSYLTLSYIVLLGVNIYQKNISKLTSIGIAWFSCLIFSFFIECFKHNLPYDLAMLSKVNRIGILLGYSLFYVIVLERNKYNKHN